MSKVLAILVEPAGYSLDTMRIVYAPRSIDHVFIRANTLHAKAGGAPQDCLARQGGFGRLKTYIHYLRHYQAFIVNGYADRVLMPLILLNGLFFKRPMAFESDTELAVPHNPIKRLVKRLWLGWLFTRKWCYGFPAGRFAHSANFSHYGMAQDRIVVMPMVVENEVYKPSAERKEHTIFRFGFIGRLIQLKQVDKIIEALPNGCELLVVGDGEERNCLEELSANRKVLFTGALFGHDKINALHSMDCLVLYSTHDQWGYVVNEALASGVPVIVSDQVGSRHELVEGDKPTGLIAKWDEVRDLSEKMRQLAGDAALQKRLSENALERMAHWNYDYYCRQLDTWLGRVMK